MGALSLLTLFSLATTAWAQMGRPIETAKGIRIEEAQKKYPVPKGGYPPATEEGRSGIYRSPYTGHSFDCRDVKKNEVVLDPVAKKVFRLP